MGSKIGACMGEVTESEIFEIKEKGTFLKVLVLFDSTKPLKPGIMLEVDLMGTRKEEKNEEDDNVRNFGPWMRAVQIGRKTINKDQGTDYQKRQTASKQKKSTLPKEVLDMLSTLSMTQKTPLTIMGNNTDKTTETTGSQGTPAAQSQEINSNSHVTQEENVDFKPTAETTNKEEKVSSTLDTNSPNKVQKKTYPVKVESGK
ncbi:hypothetical protein SESBI_41674 [Sesbania bispinosa]|nr:hypothetical protein SESBI_41674 [Sesbania bispinosa]